MKIHRVKTRLVNSYIIEYPERLLVVDVAVKCHRQVLGFVEQELGRPVAEIELAICTHDDPDHIGGLGALAELCGARVGIPYAAASKTRKWRNDPTGALVRFATGLREAFRPRAWQMYVNRDRDASARKQAHYRGPRQQQRDESPDLLLKHRHALPDFPDWQVIHTPGHSWDSCCYFHAASGSLISGDTLLGSDKLGRLVVPSIYANRRQTLRTLKTLAALDIRAVYPGHGSPQFGEDVIAKVKF